MSEGSKEQQLAKSRRGYLAQIKMLTVGERAQEAAKINKLDGQPQWWLKAVRPIQALSQAPTLAPILGVNAEADPSAICPVDTRAVMVLGEAQRGLRSN